jgi:hypothetical protein
MGNAEEWGKGEGKGDEEGGGVGCNGACLCLSLSDNAYLVPHTHVHMNCNIIKYLIKHIFEQYLYYISTTATRHLLDICSTDWNKCVREIPRLLRTSDFHPVCSTYLVKLRTRKRRGEEPLTRTQHYQMPSSQSKLGWIRTWHEMQWSAKGL